MTTPARPAVWLLLVAITGCTAILGIGEPAGSGDGDGDGGAVDSGDVCTGVDLDIDEAHCGACAAPCSTHHGTPTCGGGECSIACTGSFRDCVNGPRTDGCETDLDRDPEHCGACDQPCPTAVNATATCAPGGQCGLECQASFGNCELSAPDCETSLSTSDDCGACGHSCLGGACAAATCQPVEIVTNLFNPGALVVDGDYVYFVRRKPIVPYDLMRVKKDASAAPEKLGTTTSNTFQLAVDATFLYYLEGTALKRVDKLPPEDAGTVVVADSDLGGFVVADGFIYECGADPGPGTEHLVRKTSTTMPSTPTTLATTEAGCNFMVADATYIYWVDDGILPIPDSAAVRGIGKDGTGPADFGTVCAGFLEDFAGDADALYALHGCTPTGHVTRIDKAGGPNQFFLPTSGKMPSILLADGTHLYTALHDAAPDESRVIRYDKDGSNETVLFIGAMTQIDFMAADADALYFTDNRSKTMRRLAK